MEAYRTRAKIDEEGKLIIDGVPYERGEMVEVFILPASENYSELASEWYSLLRDIQANYNSSGIDESDIRSEIESFRKGQ
jgi:hypothetical protein